MPTLLPPDAKRSERLVSAERSNRFIAEHLTQWMESDAGKFVVVCDGQLVAMDRDPNIARAKAREAGVALSGCLIMAIPRRGASHYF